MSTTTFDPKTLTRDGALIAFHVYGQPVSVNHMYGARKGDRGGKYLTPEAHAWKVQVWGEVIAWRATHGLPACTGVIPGCEHGVRVRITVFGVRGDADNYAKLTCDGLARGLGIDDRHFRSVEMVKESARRGVSGVYVEVWPATPAPEPVEGEAA